MPRFKLFNKTKWDTRALRKLCMAVIKATGSTIRHSILVRTKTRHYNQYHGRATLNGSWITMFVPPTERRIRKFETVVGDDGQKHISGKHWETEQTKFHPKSFAQVLTHEIHHNMGLNHGEMVSVEQLEVDYTENIVVQKKAEKQKPKINLVEQRFSHAEMMLKKADTRLKRAKTLKCKWQKKVNYYKNKYGDAQ